MKHRYIKQNRAQKKDNRATLLHETRMIKVDAIKPEKVNMHGLIGNLEEHIAIEGHIAFLIFLVIGMFLQTMGNTFCVLAGTLICVSVCGLICLWVCISAVSSHDDSRSLSRTSEFLE